MIHTLLAAAVLLAPTADEPVPGTPVLTFQDPRIQESSGLVDLGPLMATVNDSGDVGRVYVVDPASGQTVGTTTFADDVRDVEALAPAGRGHVWVGDLGGNLGGRDTVDVYRVPVGRGDRTVTPEHHVLRYPEGKHDAESLFTGPDGRLYLITKAFGGGVVYRAPARLGRVAELAPVAQVPDFATDAALTADGRHVLVRSLRQASVYTFPGFRRVQTFLLPRQRQGEGISVGPGGRVRLSSEGRRAKVVQIAVPPAPASPSQRPSPAPGARGPGDGADGDGSWLAWVVAGVVLAAAAGIGYGTRRGRS